MFAFDEYRGLFCLVAERPVGNRPILEAVPGAPSGPAGASMGDRTMPPPRGPVNPRKKFAVKPGFSMLVGQRADLFFVLLSCVYPQAFSVLSQDGRSLFLEALFA